MIPVSSCVWLPGVAAIEGGGGGHRSKGWGNGKSPKTGGGGGGGENGLQYRIEFIVNC